MMLATTAAQAQDTPPYVAPPADARPVMVMVELKAQNPEDFRAYLESAAVIPTTRLASGIHYSWTTQDPESPETFVLIQSWTSARQHADYIAWRQETGALEDLTSQLTEAPRVVYLDPVDMMTLPVDAPRG